METSRDRELTDNDKVAARRIAGYIADIPYLRLLADRIGAGKLAMAATDKVLLDCVESCAGNCGDARCWARDIWDLYPEEVQEKFRIVSREFLAEYRKSLN